MPQGRTRIRTHADAILDPGDLGEEDEWKGDRLFTNDMDFDRGNRPPLSTYDGMLPFYGRHRRPQTKPTPGDIMKSPVNERR